MEFYSTADKPLPVGGVSFYPSGEALLHGPYLGPLAAESTGEGVKLAVKGFLYKRYAKVIGVSQYVTDRLRDQGCSSDLKTCHHFLNTERFRPDPAVRAEVRRELGALEHFVVIVASYLGYPKGHDVAIKGASEPAGADSALGRRQGATTRTGYVYSSYAGSLAWPIACVSSAISRTSSVHASGRLFRLSVALGRGRGVREHRSPSLRSSRRREPCRRSSGIDPGWPDRVPLSL